MTGSVGRSERVFRLTLGILILGLYGALPVPWRYLTLVGFLPFGTALTGYCPFRAAMSRKDV
jgi:hypothetical protein